MIKKIEDYKFNELMLSGQITKEIFKMLSLDQRQELFNNNKTLFYKFTADDDDGEITIEKLEKMGLNEWNELNKKNPKLYAEMNAEHQKLMQGEIEFYNNQTKLLKLLKSIGLGKYFNDVLVAFRKDNQVKRHHDIFSQAVNEVLQPDRQVLKKWTSEQLIKNISISFNNKLYERGY